ncbi:MAG: hypothetical protein LBE13_06255 [Bacteroidales bacterium]|jgi:hypothetical protein|nr:hypothetical protein [Bacteroidales bacterium]
MEEHPEIDVCGSWMEIFGNRTGIIKPPVEHKQIAATMLLYNPIGHPTVIMRKSVCKNKKCLYSIDYLYAEDYKLWTDLAIEGFRFTNIQEVLLLSRSSNNQVTNTRGVEMMETSRKIQVEYAQQVIEQMVEKDEKFSLFFDSLIDLSNEDVIEVKKLLEILYSIYIGYRYGKK